MTGTCRNTPDEIQLILHLWRQGNNSDEIAAQCNMRFKHMARTKGSVKYLIAKHKNDPAYAPRGATPEPIAVSGATFPQPLGPQSQASIGPPGLTGVSDTAFPPPHGSQNQPSRAIVLQQGHPVPQHGVVDDIPSFIFYRPSASGRDEILEVRDYVSPEPLDANGFTVIFPRTRAQVQAPPRSKVYKFYSPKFPYAKSQKEWFSGDPVNVKELAAMKVDTLLSFESDRSNETDQPPVASTPPSTNPTGPKLAGPTVGVSYSQGVYGPPTQLKNPNPRFQGAPTQYPGLQAYGPSTLLKNPNTGFQGAPIQYTGPQIGYGPSPQLKKPNSGLRPAPTPYTGSQAVYGPPPHSNNSNPCFESVPTQYPGSQSGYHPQLKNPIPGSEPVPIQYIGVQNPSHGPNKMNAGPTLSSAYVRAPQHHGASQLNHQLSSTAAFIDPTIPSSQSAASPFVPPTPSSSGYAPQIPNTFNSEIPNIPTSDLNHVPVPPSTQAGIAPTAPVARKTKTYQCGNLTLLTVPEPDPNQVPLLSSTPAGSAPNAPTTQKTDKFNPGNLTLPTPNPNYVPLPPNTQVGGEAGAPSVATAHKTKTFKCGNLTLSTVPTSKPIDVPLPSKYRLNYPHSSETAPFNKRKADQISASKADEQTQSAKKPKLSTNNGDHRSALANQPRPSSSASRTPSVPSHSASTAPSLALSASPIPPPQLLESHMKKRKSDQIYDLDEARLKTAKRHQANWERDAHEEQETQSHQTPMDQMTANQASPATPQEETGTASAAVSVSPSTAPSQPNSPETPKSDDINTSSTPQENNERYRTWDIDEEALDSLRHNLEARKAAGEEWMNPPNLPDYDMSNPFGWDEPDPDFLDEINGNFDWNALYNESDCKPIEAEDEEDLTDVKTEEVPIIGS